MRAHPILPLLLVPLLLVACSPAPDQAGGITADDQRQLNEAAEMLDANSIDLNAVSAEPGNESPAP